jgi:pyruvate/2-oxoglutarate/acetoin dehydrogenase E1 component
MGRYFDELKKSMEFLADDPRTIFLGQAVGSPGTFMYGTVEGVPASKRLEFPVCESFQMQFSLGLALTGSIPISIFPRQNFMLLACSDLANMIDKMPAISDGVINPRVIIRVAAGTTRPIHPGHQHVGNFADAFRSLLTTVRVVELHEPWEIFPAYANALEYRGATLLIEFGDFIGEK